MRLSAFIGIIGRYSSNASLCPTLRTNWSMRATTNEERMLERPDAYSLVSFASRHGISRSKVYGEIRAGRLTARKIGDRTIILWCRPIFVHWRAMNHTPGTISEKQSARLSGWAL
jgi:hypothetical protein